MTTVSEVVVKAIPEGMSDVRSGLQGMNEDVEETTDSMSEQADALGDISKGFTGAMSAVAAGFAVAAGSLLSKVPVLGETMTAFGFVVDMLALKMDTVLRPIMSRVNDLVFAFGETIGESEGPLAAFIGIVTTLGSVVAIVAGAIVSVVTGFLALGGSMATVVAFGKTVLSVVGSLIAAFVGWPVLIAAAVVALLGLAYVFRDEIREFAGKAWQAIKDFANDSINTIEKLIKNFGGRLRAFAKVGLSIMGDFAADMGDVFRDLIAEGFSMGEGLVLAIIRGIVSAQAALKDQVMKIVSFIRSLLPGSDAETGPLSDLTASGAALPETFAKGISQTSDVSIEATSDAMSGKGKNDFIGSVGGGSNKIYLDGSRVDDNQGRFRKSALNRRS